MIKSFRDRAIAFLFVALMIGLLYSHAIQSVSMILLILIAFFDFGLQGSRPYFSLNKTTIKQYGTVFKRPSYWLFSLLFFYLLLPHAACTDIEYWTQRAIIKLPFIFLPAAFLTYPDSVRKYLPQIFYFFLIIIVVQLILIAINQWQTGIPTKALFGVGHSVSTPGNHIKFSVLCALVLITNFYYIINVSFYHIF